MNDPAGATRRYAAPTLAAALALAALPAAAQQIIGGAPAGCGVMAGDYRLGNLDENPEADYFGTTFIEYVAPEFIEWTVFFDNGDEQRVLQHCSSGRELILRTAFRDTGPVNDRFDRMVYGEHPYTLGQIASALEDEGARARQTRNTQGDCGCLIMFGDG